jgi:hypothetical protein
MDGSHPEQKNELLRVVVAEGACSHVCPSPQLSLGMIPSRNYKIFSSRGSDVVKDTMTIFLVFGTTVLALNLPAPVFLPSQKMGGKMSALKP